MKFLKSIFRGLFSEEISSLQKQIQSKQMALAEKETTISEIRHEKRQLAGRIGASRQNITKLENIINILQSTISAKDAELSVKDQRIIVLERSLSRNRYETKQDKELINYYRQQIDCLESAKNELEQIIENQKLLIQEKNGSVSVCASESSCLKPVDFR